jgi:hypothetical protein
MYSERGISAKLRRLTTPVKCLTDNPRGARHCGASSRRELVCGRSIRILTMMQSCASAAKLRAAGPFSRSASVPCSSYGSRHLGSSVRQPAKSQRERRMVLSGLLVR